jgi:hypothetical protein
MRSIIDRIAQSLLLPTVALTTLIFCLSNRGFATDTYEFIGKDANYTGPCNVQQCNNNDGCRVTADIYDKWYPGYSCNGGENPGGSCDQDFRLCREITHWDNSNCSGNLEYTEWVNQGLCSGGGTPKFPA